MYKFETREIFDRWLGFVAKVTVSTVLFERRPGKLYFINSGYQLVNLLLTEAVLAVRAVDFSHAC